jgi:hypothetical protein
MPFRILLVLVILIIPLIPTFWAILDIPKRRFPSSRNKMLWFLMVATVPCLGALCYLAFARRHTQPIEISSQQ